MHAESVRIRCLSTTEAELVGGGPALVIPPLLIAFGKGFAGGVGAGGIGITVLDAMGIIDP